MITEVGEILCFEGIKQVQTDGFTEAMTRGVSCSVQCEKSIKIDKIATVFVHKM